MTSTVRTFCRLCQSLCGVLAEIDGDRVVRVKGDAEHPLSQGYTCTKGRSLPEYHHDPHRLQRPLMRVNGELRAVSWSDALDLVAANLNALRAEGDVESIGVFQGTHAYMDAAGRALAKKFFLALGTPQFYSTVTLDAPNKTLVPDLIAGTPFAFPVIDWDEVRTVVLVGVNPVVSHGHATGTSRPRVRLRGVRDRGGSIVVADPRETDTARLADVHLRVQPSAMLPSLPISYATSCARIQIGPIWQPALTTHRSSDSALPLNRSTSTALRICAVSIGRTSSGYAPSSRPDALRWQPGPAYRWDLRRTPLNGWPGHSGP